MKKAKLKNTDAILALTEKDISESPSAKLVNLQIEYIVVFCGGTVLNYIYNS